MAHSYLQILACRILTKCCIYAQGHWSRRDCAIWLQMKVAIDSFFDEEYVLTKWKVALQNNIVMIIESGTNI